MTDLSALDSQVDAWLRPISESQPQGIEDDLDPRFEAVQHALSGRGGVTGAPDWPTLLAPAQGYLQEVGKDVRPMVAIALALFKANGVSGLAVGLLGLAKLIEVYPETAYPERAKRRTNALLTLESRLAGWLPAAKDGLRARDAEAVAQALTAAERLEAAFSKHWDGSVGQIVSELRRMQAALPAVAPPPPEPEPAPEPEPVEEEGSTDDLPDPAEDGDPEPEPAPKPEPKAARHKRPKPAPPKARPAPAVAVPEPISAANTELGTYLRRTGKQLAVLALEMQSEDPTLAEAYRLRRAAIWLPYGSAPPADDDNKTRAPSPALDNLRLMQKAGRHDALLRDAEAMVDDFPFALELHYLVASALEALGDEYAGARFAVESEVAAFLRRAPELPDMLAVDGTPFASEAAQAWLDTLGPSAAGAVVSSGPPAQVQVSDQDLDGLFEVARAHATQGDVPGAFAHLEAAARGAASARLRFSIRLEAAKLALDAKESALAEGILTSLDEEARTHGLMVWEPSLAAQLLMTWLDLLKTKKADGKDRAKEVFERLCAVDPSAALGRAP